MAKVRDNFLAVYPDGEGGQVAYLPNMDEVKRWAGNYSWWLKVHGYEPLSTTFGPDYISVEAPGCAKTTYVVEKAASA
jgi:hypothetical protein